MQGEVEARRARLGLRQAGPRRLGVRSGFRWLRLQVPGPIREPV